MCYVDCSRAMHICGTLVSTTISTILRSSFRRPKTKTHYSPLLSHLRRIARHSGRQKVTIYFSGFTPIKPVRCFCSVGLASFVLCHVAMLHSFAIALLAQVIVDFSCDAWAGQCAHTHQRHTLLLGQSIGQPFRHIIEPRTRAMDCATT